MFIIAADLGSTNQKAVVLKISENEKETNIELIGKVRIKTTDFALFIYDIIEKYDIVIDDIEKIIVTGTGSSYLEEKYKGIEIVKVDEFNAIAYGGLILSNNEKGIIVSIGTGTTIIYSDMKEVIRLGGTGLGGGTLVGLGKAILSNIHDVNADTVSFNDLIDMAKKGNRNNVDLLIGDINKGNIGNMTKDITAANFAALYKKAKPEDYITATLNMIIENISLLVKALHKGGAIVYIGTMVSDEYVRENIRTIAKYTGSKVSFVNDSEYAIAIGAWEYYLLNIRKNY